MGTAWRRLAPHDVGSAASAPYLTVFLLDGLSDSVFRAELEAGRLPQVAALVREGALAEG